MISFDMTDIQRCVTCEGEGVVRDECVECNGQGEFCIACDEPPEFCYCVPDDEAEEESYTEDCCTCQGRGWNEYKCNDCTGTGVQRQVEP
jgi:DnaJ-class molecular chaperone